MSIDLVFKTVRPYAEIAVWTETELDLWIRSAWEPDNTDDAVEWISAIQCAILENGPIHRRFSGVAWYYDDPDTGEGEHEVSGEYVVEAYDYNNIAVYFESAESKCPDLGELGLDYVGNHRQIQEWIGNFRHAVGGMERIAVCDADGTVFGVGDTLMQAVKDAGGYGYGPHPDDLSPFRSKDPKDTHLRTADFRNSPGLYWCPIAYHAYVSVRDSGDVERSICESSQPDMVLI